MPRPKKDNARENRIMTEIVVDAHDPEERAMSWYYYLSDTLQFPFSATCKSQRQISPLKIGDAVEVVGIANGNECEREMFITIR